MVGETASSATVFDHSFDVYPSDVARLLSAIQRSERWHHASHCLARTTKRSRWRFANEISSAMFAENAQLARTKMKPAVED
jgi:hypothetical protein